MNMSCNPTDSDVPVPDIAGIYTRLDDRTNFTFDGVSATAFRTFFISLENGDDKNNISKMSVIDPNNIRWIWESDDLDKSWNPHSKEFELWYCYSSQFQHEISLGQYTIQVTSTSGNVKQFHFTVYARGNDENDNGNVYSTYDGSYPRILTAPTNCWIKDETDSILIGFTSNDYICTDAFLRFYGEKNKYLGRSPYLSDYTTINTEGENEVSVPKNDLDNIDLTETRKIVLSLFSKKVNSNNSNSICYISCSEKISFEYNQSNQYYSAIKQLQSMDNSHGDAYDQYSPHAPQAVNE